MSDTQLSPLVPTEGWHLMHLFYRIEHGLWQSFTDDEKRHAKTRLTELVQEINAHPETQLFTYAVATPKADLCFFLLTPDLQDAVAFEKRLTLSLGADVLTPVYSYLSQTERSEYTTTREQYAAETLVAEEGLDVSSELYAQKLVEFDERMEKYAKHRLYPVLPPWPMMCFYNMSKRRNLDDNWYALPYEERRKLMAGHAITGRRYSGKILQLIGGSTGLDEAEWGVTLLAHNPKDIKDIVYEMRFDEVSSRYGEFGDFYICLHLPLVELFHRLCL